MGKERNIVGLVISKPKNWIFFNIYAVTCFEQQKTCKEVKDSFVIHISDVPVWQGHAFFKVDLSEWWHDICTSLFFLEWMEFILLFLLPQGDIAKASW